MLTWLRRLIGRAAGKLAAPEAAATGAAAAKTLPGVDVSSYQGTPGQWRGEAGNISWAAVKITELEPGGIRYVNPDAADDWNYLRQARKGRIAYLFGHPSVDAAASVSFFVSELTKLGLEDGDGISLDFEVTDGLGPAQVDAWAAQVLADLRQKLARLPVVYTFISFAQEGNCARLGGYPLWIADPSRSAGQPRVPAPWRTWAIHQYSITNPIDRDVANYPTLAAMAATLGKRKEPPPLENLGGTIVGDVSSVRWDSGLTVVAGLGKDGFVQASRWDGSRWEPWRNISLTKAVGAPGLLAWGTGKGQLYYTDAAGHVQLMSTQNSGQTWT
jgi:lysozyme